MARGDFTDIAARAALWAQRVYANDTSECDEAVNDALVHVTGLDEPFDFLEFVGQFSASAGTQDYTFETIGTAVSVTEIKDIYAVVNDTDGTAPLVYMNNRDLESFSLSTRDNDSAGYPVAWTTTGSNELATLRLWPPPDSADSFTVLGRKKQQEDPGDDSVPILVPTQWHYPVLASYAAMQLLLADSGGSAQQYGRLKEMHDEALEAMIESHGRATGHQLRIANESWKQDLPGGLRPDW